jgi:uncharacterized membrane protein YphA (DoxX/SURF4 family)
MAIASLAGTGASSAPARRWAALAGYLGGAVFGAVLLVAAWAKAIDPAAFAAQIRAEGLELLIPARAVALLALALEAGLGVALLLGVRNRWVLGTATLLALFFLFLTGRTWWRAEHGILPEAGCGCFGNLVERTPKQAFFMDLVLLALPLALAWLARPATPAPRSRLAAAAVAAAGAVTLGWAAPDLPLDDWATRLKPGTELARVCGGQGGDRICLTDLVPQLADGSHWVVLADVRDPGFDALAKPLNDHALARREPPVTVLADMTADEQRALFWRVAPAFDLHEVPAAMLRPLYRTLPRSFRVEGGRVVETAPGLAPALAARP